ELLESGCFYDDVPRPHGNLRQSKVARSSSNRSQDIMRVDVLRCHFGAGDNRSHRVGYRSRDRPPITLAPKKARRQNTEAEYCYKLSHEALRSLSLIFRYRRVAAHKEFRMSNGKRSL